jgi:glutamate synthase domain-containing protein 1
MCGIVGLHLKVPDLEPELGALVTPMMDCMGSRGADSSGLAVFSTPLPAGRFRYSVRLDSRQGADPEAEIGALVDGLAAATGQPVDCELRRPDGVVLAATDDMELLPDAVVMGYGRALEIVKALGSPREVCDRFHIPERSGFQAIGHTRMATESAVTTDHSHPFAPAHDLAVVHNGSFSNPATVRRKLEEQGISFVTDNDTEVAARLIGRELGRGSGIEAALKEVGNEMDGFYTLLVATDREIAVVRDSFACKPLVVAETDQYVAFTSEYIAMATLPGIESAHVFEPKPEEIHAWKRS